MRLVALILVVVALAFEIGAMRAQDIQVKNWPEDVPCDAVKKIPDGSLHPDEGPGDGQDAHGKEHLWQGH
jgi:hypothetical protein